MADRLMRVGDLATGEQFVTALSRRRAVVLANPSELLKEGVDVRWEDGKRLIKTLHQEVKVIAVVDSGVYHAVLSSDRMNSKTVVVMSDEFLH